MTDLSPDHPAVEAGARAYARSFGGSVGGIEAGPYQALVRRGYEREGTQHRPQAHHGE